MNDAMENFVERVTMNESFREALLQSPMAVLSESGLSEEEIESIKNDDAWEWIRVNWTL